MGFFDDAASELGNFGEALGEDLLNRTGIELEQAAVNALGAAVYDMNNAILGNGSVSSYNSGQLTGDYINSGSFGASSNNINSPTYYAQDYDAFAPKSKFLFKVWFHFNDAYEGLLPSLEGQGSFRGFSYVIKTIDKPKVNYEYEEVNMYNYRTKVLKTIHHEPISMSLHDDIANSVMDFFNLYRTAYSPISRLTSSQYVNAENDGMSFGSPVQSASSGKLMQNEKNFLKSVVVAQIYAGGTKANFYEFVNPRIENFDFDNMDMESSLPHGVTVSFSYDGLYFRDVNLYSETVDNWVINKVPFGIWGSSDVNTSQPTAIYGGSSLNVNSSPGSSRGIYTNSSNFGPEGGSQYNTAMVNRSGFNKINTGLPTVDGMLNTIVGSYNSALDQSVNRAINDIFSTDTIPELQPIADIYSGAATSAIDSAIGSFF